jgi:general stress protein 26
MHPMAHTDHARKLWDLIKNIKYAMLTTVHEDGTLHSRPMATQKVEFDGDLWFFTWKNTEKVFNVQKEKQVSLAYASPDDNRFVSVSGRAKVVTDRERAAELWQPGLKAFFPKGLDDPDLALLRVRVESAEYWDAPSAPIVQLVGFVKALAAGQKYQPGENETLDFKRTWLR